MVYRSAAPFTEPWRARSTSAVSCTGRSSIASKQVTWKESFNGGGSIGGDLCGHDTLWTLCPQNAVLHFIERRAGNDVGNAEAQQRRHDDHRQDRGAPEDGCA